MPLFDGKSSDGNSPNFDTMEKMSHSIVSGCQKLATVGSEELASRSVKATHTRIIKENVTGMLLMALLRDHGGLDLRCEYDEDDLKELADLFTVYFEANGKRISAKLISKEEAESL